MTNAVTDATQKILKDLNDLESQYQEFKTGLSAPIGDDIETRFAYYNMGLAALEEEAYQYIDSSHIDPDLVTIVVVLREIMRDALFQRGQTTV